jgi:hypothetical protein
MFSSKFITSLPCCPCPSLHPNPRYRRVAEGGKVICFGLLTFGLYKGYAPSLCYRLLNGRIWTIVMASTTLLNMVWLGLALRQNGPTDRELVERLLAGRRAAALREQQKELQADPRTCDDIKAACEEPIALTPNQLEILQQRLAQPLAQTRSKEDLSFWPIWALISFEQLQGVHLLGQQNTLVFKVDDLPGLVFKVPRDKILEEAKKKNREQHEKSEELQQKFSDAGWTRLVVLATHLLELEVDYGSSKISLPLLVMRESPVDFKAQELVWWDEDFDESAIEQFTRAVCRYDYSDVKYGNNPACKAKDGNLIFCIDIKTFSLNPRSTDTGLVQREMQAAQLGVIRSIRPNHIERVKAIATEELGSLSPALTDGIWRDTAFQERKAALKESLPDLANGKNHTNIWYLYESAIAAKRILKTDAELILAKLVESTEGHDDPLWQRKVRLWEGVLPNDNGDRRIRFQDTLGVLEETGVVLQLHHREQPREWDVFC